MVYIPSSSVSPLTTVTLSLSQLQSAIQSAITHVPTPGEAPPSIPWITFSPPTEPYTIEALPTEISNAATITFSATTMTLPIEITPTETADFSPTETADTPPIEDTDYVIRFPPSTPAQTVVSIE